MIGEDLHQTRRKEVVEDLPVAIVEKPNVGKSSLVNTLLGKEQNIVTDRRYHRDRQYSSTPSASMWSCRYCGHPQKEQGR